MSGRITLPAVVPDPPTWAGGSGADRYGVFAELVVGEVTHALRWIPPGSFEMGSPEGELGRRSAEGPRHTVRVPRGFWLGETPVTQALYEAVTDANPSRFKEDPEAAPRRPVEQVSWDDARAFCARLTALLPAPRDEQVRLPTEAEWEYACRAGTDAGLYSGKELTSERGACKNLDELAWYDENSGGTSQPVKGKAANPWGLYDMLGNVWEWCEDEWHDSYDGAPDDGSAWVDDTEGEGAARVVRGGGWVGVARGCRCAARDGWEPGSRGFSASASFSPPVQQRIRTIPLECDDVPRHGAATSAERVPGGAGMQRPG